MTATAAKEFTLACIESALALDMEDLKHSLSEGLRLVEWHEAEGPLRAHLVIETMHTPYLRGHFCQWVHAHWVWNGDYQVCLTMAVGAREPLTIDSAHVRVRKETGKPADFIAGIATTVRNHAATSF